jgi:hypothetical protein
MLTGFIRELQAARDNYVKTVVKVGILVVTILKKLIQYKVVIHVDTIKKYESLQRPLKKLNPSRKLGLIKSKISCSNY